ncbi:S8 family serine peptidase [Thermomonas haemolytica]|uniref:Subtilase family protein n=1 Tax=Thermomonas haemolytica TaxID=141949 RepID=A0A4R3NGC4_9GAMM|nr:S8 family serine peptidase [Thermomonas haemolytica]TCT26253.1 subtilase family protein [Thermomonas haemolytica]
MMPRQRPAIARFSAWLLALASLPALAQTTPGTPPKPPAPPPVQQPTDAGRSHSSAVGVGVGMQIDLNQVLRLGRRLFDAPSPPPAYAPGRALLAFAADGGLDPAQLAAEAGLQLVESTSLEALGLVVAELQGAPDTLPEALQRLRAAHPDVTVDLAPLWRPQTVAAPAANPAPLPGQHPGRLYAAALLGVQAAQPLARPVRVALIDGAVDPAIGLELAGFSQARFGNGGDPGQHGTSVACLLACQRRGTSQPGFFGLSPGVMLLNAAVLGTDARGQAQARALDVLRGLDWALRQNAEVINVSLGAAPDAVTARAFTLAQAKVAALIAAAGNGGPQGGLTYPAALPGVIAVAAVDAQRRPYRDGTRGSWISIAAPGVEVWVPALDVSGGRYLTGTSFAAPFVTAWAAQRLARGLPATAAVLCAQAIDLPPAGRDPQTGCGLLRWQPDAP